jgi:hypothetical protein
MDEPNQVAPIERRIRAIQERVNRVDERMPKVARDDFEWLLFAVRELHHGIVTAYWMVHGSESGRAWDGREAFERVLKDTLSQFEPQAEAPPIPMHTTLRDECDTPNHPQQMRGQFGDLFFHENSVDWYDAPLHYRWQRHRVYTNARTTDGFRVQRCSCGAFGPAPWTLLDKPTYRRLFLGVRRRDA